VKVLLCLLCLSLLAIQPCRAQWEPYNKNHGPFDEGEQPRIVSIRPCDLLESRESQEDGDSWVKVFGKEARKRMPRVHITSVPGNRFLHLSVVDPDGKVILPSRPASRFRLFSTVYWAEPNKDGKEDFIVHIWAGGCGTIFTFGCDLVFLLSNETGYEATTVRTLWSGPAYFVDLKKDGGCQFIQTTFVQGWPERSRDGKIHNYWVYNLLVIEGSRLVLTTKLDPRFPKWIWYTYKPNHQDTTLLTGEQKERLWKSYAEDIFWTPESERGPQVE
jgi:hypothetical protein